MAASFSTISLKNFHLIFLFFFLLHRLQHSTGENVVKAAYWLADSESDATLIKSHLFTHLFCAFASIDPDTNKLKELPPEIKHFTKTVQKNKANVKTLLSIGGASVPSAIFSSMARKQSSRKIFIDSSIRMARCYKFSGLDLDWEDQTMDSEMKDMASLLNEWRAAIDTEATESGETKLLLTSALAYTNKTNEVSYDVLSLKNNLDWINVMAYDIYAPHRSKFTRSHAALYDSNGLASVNEGIHAWISSTIPANKLVLGLPFYGYPWKLVNSNDHGLSAHADGVDHSLNPDQDGQIGYDVIKEFISKENADCVHDENIVSDYCYHQTTWIGYDDKDSISEKVKYAKKNKLRGYFAWQVGYDKHSELSTAACNAWKEM